MLGQDSCLARRYHILALFFPLSHFIIRAESLKSFSFAQVVYLWGSRHVTILMFVK